jgi:TolB-like protein
MSDHLLPSSPLAPSHATTAAPVPAVEASPLEGKKKKNKVRSAWISFVSRIVAQVIGAVATVVLGFAIVSNHVGKLPAVTTVTTSAAPATAGQGASESQVRHETPAAPTLVRARRTPGAALVVLPFQDFSPAGKPTALADGLTEAVTAALARGGRVHVTSRTSAMQYKAPTQSLPAIAAHLGVDFVVEGSIVRQADRVRVTVQLIDAATDTHVWAQTYDRPARDVLAFGAGVGADIDRDLRSVLPRSLQPVPPAATATADIPPTTPVAGALY